MQKYIIKYSRILFVLFVVTSSQSCDKGFVGLNVNPDASSVVSPQFVFTKAEYEGAGGGGHYGSSTPDLFLGAMQYTTSYNDVAGFGSKYVTSQISQTYASFSTAFPNEINELGIVIKALGADASKVNLVAEAK